ncbi:glycosyltransferase family 29 protein [Pontibacter locisalis]|uniref:Glycosyltransferase family 29 protein n=1 Tax=Pontibacter locisalis TaxID=1719035 RepID=A0ABW5IML6_9BACT
MVNTFEGLIMMIQNTRIFNPEKEFKDKRIAVIGAADSAFEKENGNFIDGFDYVIRVNKAPHSLTEDKYNFIGSRTDILFHSFFELTEGGGGVIDWSLYQQQGIKYVVNPNHDLKGLKAHLNYYKRHLNPNKTYLLPWNFYKEVKKNFGVWVPTVGFSALYSAVSSGCKEVYVTGFTFFKTPYANDYRDDLKDVQKNSDFLKKQGFHNPDLELQEFIKQADKQQRKGTQIIMDNALRSIVKNHKRLNNEQ